MLGYTNLIQPLTYHSTSPPAMRSLTEQKAEVNANAAAFKPMLPELLSKGLDGKYALMRKQKIEAILNDFGDAVIMGNKMFGDKPFSVQQITNEEVSLGFYSYF